MAHIGVIKALEENNIPIDYIAGTSAGALIGGLYASHLSAKKLEDFAKEVKINDIATIYGDIGTVSGIAKGNKLEEYLKEVLLVKNIEDLQKPFIAVSTNAETGEPVYQKSGNLARAIRASSSIPGIFDIVTIDKDRLTDGGVSEAVPVRAVKKLGAEVVIAVNLDTYNFITTKEKPLATDMGALAIKLLRFHLARELCKEADVVIAPDVADVTSLNLVKFIHGEEIIKLGYQATEKLIPEIKSKLN